MKRLLYILIIMLVGGQATAQAADSADGQHGDTSGL